MDGHFTLWGIVFDHYLSLQVQEKHFWPKHVQRNVRELSSQYHHLISSQNLWESLKD